MPLLLSVESINICFIMGTITDSMALDWRSRSKIPHLVEIAVLQLLETLRN